MRIRLPALTKLGGLTLATVSRSLMSTLEYRSVKYDRSTDPVHPDFCGRAIFLFWHEYIPFLFYLRGHCNTAMMLSRHHDAEWLSCAARHMGFTTIRGSTSRGGVQALREALERSRSMNLAITPDGPRGPRRVLAQGPVFLSSKLQIPLVLVGLGYQKCWRAPTWDRFAVPAPYTRARGICSPYVQIPANLDREGIEHYRKQMERMLNQLTHLAERWAARGTAMPGQHAERREAIPIALQRQRADRLRHETASPTRPPLAGTEACRQPPSVPTRHPQAA